MNHEWMTTDVSGVIKYKFSTHPWMDWCQKWVS